MDFKPLFLSGVLAVLAVGCVTEEPAGSTAPGTMDLNSREYPYIGYFASLRGAIFERWSYPPEAVQKNYEGDVRVEFTIQRSGHLGAVKVLASSGHKELDDAIVKAIKSAGPFLPLPAEFNVESLSVQATFKYVRALFAPDPPPVTGKRRRPGPKKGLEIAP